MNYAHLHLILNHIPVVGLPIALWFLAYGYFRGHPPTTKFGLVTTIAIAALALPTYFTGEPAEEFVERIPGVAESFIKAHENSAQVSLFLILFTGIMAIGALRPWRSERIVRYTVLGTILAAMISTASLAYTANLSGKIRHTEIRSNASEQTKSNQQQTYHGDGG